LPEVAVIGAGQSRFGVRNDVSMAELAHEAFKHALNTANIEKKDIDFVIVANMGIWSSEILTPAMICEYSGIKAGSMRVEAACASGSAAISAGYSKIASGECEAVLVLGLEKMNEVGTQEVVELIGRAGNYFWVFENFGMTFPGYYALYATAYMDKYGAREEDLALVSVKNHYYGARNPNAHFRKEVRVEDVMESPYISWPLKLLDCSPISDGASAVILASEEMAKENDDKIWIRSQGYSTGYFNTCKKDDFTSIHSARISAQIAYRKAGIENPAKQVDVAEVHDCFTIAEIMAYEDLGFVKKGKGVELIREEQTYIGGKIPVNLDGGLKAKGHPIGATGVSQAVEMYKQLLWKAEKGRQAEIKNGIGLTHNVGGDGHFSYVTIYSTEVKA